MSSYAGSVLDRRDPFDFHVYTSCRDRLTGLLDLQYFKERLAEERAKLATCADYAFAIVVVDVAALQQINETFGLSSGDEVLVSVAAFLECSVRAGDVVCRLGGDEFGILMPSASDLEVAVIEQLLRGGANAGLIDLPFRIALRVGGERFGTVH